jgi:hypothetical protein
MSRSLFGLIFLLVSVGCATSPFKRKYPEMPLAELQKLNGDYHEHYFYTLQELTERAADDNDCTRSAALARDLLKEAEDFRTNWNYGNAIYLGHMTLGYCELTDIKAKSAVASKKAITHLHAAGNTPGSAQLKSFGLPTTNLMLVKELLGKGKKEREAVLKFLEQARKFWNDPTALKSLDQWAAEIRAGKTPEFKYAL